MTCRPCRRHALAIPKVTDPPACAGVIAFSSIGTADTADAVLLGGSLPLCFVNPFSGLFHHSGSSSTVLLVLGSQCFLPFPFPEHFECVLAAGRFMWLGRGWLG